MHWFVCGAGCALHAPRTCGWQRAAAALTEAERQNPPLTHTHPTRPFWESPAGLTLKVDRSSRGLELIQLIEERFAQILHEICKTFCSFLFVCVCNLNQCTNNLLTDASLFYPPPPHEYILPYLTKTEYVPTLPVQMQSSLLGHMSLMIPSVSCLNAHKSTGGDGMLQRWQQRSSWNTDALKYCRQTAGLGTHPPKDTSEGLL